MSYLTDDPLTKEEESALANAEFDYMVQDSPPSRLRQLHPAVFTPSSFRPNPFPYGNQLISMPIKIDLRRKSRSNFIIDMETYRHILQILESRHGDRTPVNDQFECLSINIVTKPNSNCCLYYRPNEGSQSKFYLISKIQTYSKPRQYTIACPYTDTYLTMKHKQQAPDGYSYLYFNWLYNSSAGRIVPYAYKSTFIIPESNGLMPWLSSDMYGTFLITGITDHITFNISFVLASNARIEGKRQIAARKVKQNRRIKQSEHMKHKHIGRTHRQMLGQPGEIQYEIPSQEFEYFTDGEDPLYEAFQ